MAKKKSNKNTAKKNRARRKELEKEFKALAKKANEKLAQMNKSGLREMNMSFVRKWNETLREVGTLKQSIWKTGTSKLNMSEMKELMAKMATFVSSEYNTVEYTKRYVQNIKERTGIKNTDVIKDLFRIYRTYGLKGEYGSDPQAIDDLAQMANIQGFEKEEDFEQFFLDFKERIEERNQEPVTTDILKQAIVDYNLEGEDYFDVTF